MTAVLQIDSLDVRARLAGGTQAIVDKFSLEVHAGEIVGVVGESGSGKTTLVRSLVGLLDKNVHVTGGTVTFRGRQVLTSSIDETASLRGRHVGVIFQDAVRSLDPLFKVRTLLREVLKTHESNVNGDEASQRMVEVLRRMRVTDAGRVLDSYPHQLSGGLCQRVAIALAVITQPELILADECTTALDVTTQADVVALLKELVVESGISLVFVTHNLMLASELCDRVVVMYGGQAVEIGPTSRVLSEPHHPYSVGLLDAIPSWDTDRPLKGIAGHAPRVMADAHGCVFAERCPLAADDCTVSDIGWSTAGDGGGYRCSYPLNLSGAHGGATGGPAVKAGPARRRDV